MKVEWVNPMRAEERTGIVAGPLPLSQTTAHAITAARLANVSPLCEGGTARRLRRSWPR
jgi:hypothetical protein